MATLTETKYDVGEIVSVNIPLGQYRIRINAEIMDIRERYGRVDYKIMPISGAGTAWVSESSIYGRN